MLIAVCVIVALVVLLSLYALFRAVNRYFALQRALLDAEVAYTLSLLQGYPYKKR
jgi:hypothetical protein